MKNRIIKFRAWHPESKSMAHFTLDRVSSGMVSTDRGDDFYPESIMQFTGLLDKNGKEIYEGDVVKLHCSSNIEHVATATIVWRDDGAAKFVPDIHDKKLMAGNPKREVSMREMHSWTGGHSCFSYPRYIEVIGNIYESGELLK